MGKGQNDELRYIVDVYGQLIGFPAARASFATRSTCETRVLMIRWVA